MTITKFLRDFRDSQNCPFIVIFLDVGGRWRNFP